MNEYVSTALASSDWTWVDSVISLAAILCAGVFVKWQVDENARKNLWQQIYKEIVEANRKLIEAELQFSSYVYSTASNYSFLLKGVLNKFQDARVEEIRDHYTNLNAARSDLINVLEAYEITSPKLNIFRTAFSAAFADVDVEFSRLFDRYLKTMSMDLSQGIVHQPTPSDAEVREFDALSHKLIEKLLVIKSYSHDLNVEAQNLLLGGVFKHRVPRREPLVVDAKVIALDNAEQLKFYFENETEWARRNARFKERLNGQLRDEG
ncbi:MAG: hypothetical protein RIA63_06985, partial [Cyclobacteriaceae bacterium]